MNAYIYYWHVNDELNDQGEKELMIRAYGITTQDETIILHIKNFKPWLYLEVKKDKKTNSEWTQCKTFIKNKMIERCTHLRHQTFYLVQKKKLYFDDRLEYPYFKLRFPTIQSRRNAFYSLENYKCRSMGTIYEIKCHEMDASPLLQLIVSKNLPTAGWIKFEGKQIIEKKDRLTTKYREYIVDYNNINGIDQDEEYGIPEARVMSFDIEVYSSNSQRMPQAELEMDKIFQISCVVKEKKDKMEKYLLTMGKVCKIKVGKDITIYEYETEKELLLAFSRFVREKNAHVLIGYNIFGFDIPYMIKRCKLYDILNEFNRLGIPEEKHAPEKEITWSSTAYSYQEFHYLETEGRIWIDLLPVIKRDYKFNNYKLKTVATYFLGETKDPLTAQDIFKAYELGMQGEKEKLSECGKYCVQDSALVLKLYNILQLWIGLSEMAKICNVPIMYLFTKGQQIKVYSQVYKKCFDDNILVDNAKENKILDSMDGYSGAFVFPPEPGIYDWVIPFDFSSLYPTTIIAYNIDYSSLVLDESKVDLSECHVIEWEDHINCEHDETIKKINIKKKKLCGTNRFVFRKHPIGVIPSLLQNLLSQRAETKRQMKNIDKNETRMIVLDKRQLAYKLSANSMYGAMGVRKGYLPFMPGAMSTTAMGRLSIQKAADFVKRKYQGQLIYGDSVEKNTIIVFRDIQHKLGLLTIEELFLNYFHTQEPYPQFKPSDVHLKDKQKVTCENIEIMSKNGWTPIRKIIRHFTNKKLFEIITNTGKIIVTEDHSLLSLDGNHIKPTEIKKGEQLLYWKEDSLFWKNTHLDIPSEIIDHLEIHLDGTIDFFNITNDKQISLLYLYINQIFPSTTIKFFNDKIQFLPNYKNNESLGVILSITPLAISSDYVYDIETEDGTFHAGIGNLIVKNTDSIYCHFPGYIDAKTSWNMAKKVENELLQLFPSPMKLIFEEKIYKRFLILTKKRYMAYTCGKNGDIDNNLTIRGVLLARRDNCKWIRVLYEQIVRLLMNNQDRSHVYESIQQYVLDLMTWKTTHLSNFIITKQVNKNYKIKSLPTDPSKCFKRLQDLGIYDYPKDQNINISLFNSSLDNENFVMKYPWLQKYVIRTKPSHIQLSVKMNQRGKPIEIGSRIEFIIIRHTDDFKAKLYDKLEDPLYFKHHRDILRLDRFYYFKSLIDPLDQLLNVVFHEKNFVSKLYELHLLKHKIHEEIYSKNTPIILFDDEKFIPKKSKKKSIVLSKKNYTLYDFL